MKQNPVRLDKVKNVLEAVRKMAESRVLIGIPATAPTRKGEPMSNASLGYIHEFGAPEANIPARPFLVPGVQAARAAIARGLRGAAKKAISAHGDARAAVTDGLEKAGQVAANAVKRKISAGPFAPLSPHTFRKRDRALFRKLSRGMYSTEQAQAAEDAKLAARKPLIDTAQMRNAVTYVVK